MILLIQVPLSQIPLKKDIIDFKAKVTGIKDRNAILLTVNGIENTKFSYDVESGMITDKISLIPGETTINVTAVNVFGESSNEISVLFNKKRRPQKEYNFFRDQQPGF